MILYQEPMMLNGEYYTEHNYVVRIQRIFFFAQALFMSGRRVRKPVPCYCAAHNGAFVPPHVRVRCHQNLLEPSKSSERTVSRYESPTDDAASSDGIVIEMNRHHI